MKIDFTQIIINEDGEPIKEGQNPFTLGRVCAMAMRGTFEGDRADGGEKFDRFVLAQTVKMAKEPIEISAEDLVKIKNMIGKVMTTDVVGYCWPLLDSSIRVSPK